MVIVVDKSHNKCTLLEIHLSKSSWMITFVNPWRPIFSVANGGFLDARSEEKL